MSYFSEICLRFTVWIIFIPAATGSTLDGVANQTGEISLGNGEFLLILCIKSKGKHIQNIEIAICIIACS